MTQPVPALRYESIVKQLPMLLAKCTTRMLASNTYSWQGRLRHRGPMASQRPFDAGPSADGQRQKVHP